MKGNRFGPASESKGFPGKPVRILHLEDNLNGAELVEGELRGAGIACALQRVETREAFLQALEGEGLDLILSDFSLPAFDGSFGAPARAQALSRGAVHRRLQHPRRGGGDRRPEGGGDRLCSEGPPLQAGSRGCAGPVRG